MIADIWPPSHVGYVGIAHTKDGHRSGSPDGSVGMGRADHDQWVAARPVMLSASGTAFGLVGLDTGEIMVLSKPRPGQCTARAPCWAYLNADCTQSAC